MKINNLFQVWEYWQNSAVINGSKLFWGSVVDEKNVLQLIFVPLKWDSAMVLSNSVENIEKVEKITNF